MAASGMAQQTPDASPRSSSIGYPSVAAALEALRARSDVKISNQGDWTIVDDPGATTVWSFTPPNHPAHPAVVKRAFVQKENGAWDVVMNVLCQADKPPCDKLVADFQALNERMRETIAREKGSEKKGWVPSEQQKTRATNTVSRYLEAIDQGRYRDAYEQKTPGMKRMMSLDQFVSWEENFKAKSGGDPVRTDTRITWYKDPPKAQAPGVYAAFDIKCRFRNIDTCSEVMVLHEQSNGEFLVMRHELNFVDKGTERRMRESQKKREGS